MPSGAWADAFDRRSLLALSGIVHGCGFACWMLFPSFAGFAVGFVLWGVSSALMSGTFDALVYDELATAGTAAGFARLLGWAESAALVANLSATALAAPLFAWGGYPAVGWASVLLAAVNGALAFALPRARPVGLVEAAAVGGYTAMLRTGIAEVVRRPPVRRLVILLAAVSGLLSYDEYFPLLARDAGFTTGTVPVVVAATVLAQAVGSAFAGRTERLPAGALASMLGVGVVLMSAGTLASSPIGFAAMAIAYGLMSNVIIVTAARLQHGIEGAARATVTSVSGWSSELVALGVYGVVGLGATWWSLPVVVAALGGPALLTAVLTRRWLPPVDVSGRPTLR